MSDHSQAVQMAYNCVLFLVDADVSREVAEAAIDNAPKVRTGMSFAVRNAVLDMFEPEREPVPFKDYLPEPGCAGHTGADDCPNHVLRPAVVEPAPAGAWGVWP